MNLRLFFLIHNERPYKRYYGQQLSRRFLGGLLHEVKDFKDRYIQAFRLTFDPKLNKQQFPGKRKSKGKILWENLMWCFKYKEACNYYYLYGLDLKEHNPKDYVAYTEFRVLRNILNIRLRENEETKYTFNYLALCRDKFIFGQYAQSLGIPHPQTIALVKNGMVSFINDGTFLDFQPLRSLLDKDLNAFAKVCDGEGGLVLFH